LTYTLRLLAAAPEEAVLLAGDLNLRDWEARRAGIGDDGGNKWFDAWHVAGAEKALASTWKGLRFDRILFRRSGPLEPISDGFFISEAPESDHRGIRSVLRLQPTADAQIDSLIGLALPLRRGARARCGRRGVGRRPTKHEACAKIEQSTVHDAGGPQYYCGKHFEKPRIPPGDAALLEDERRRNLWRLFLSRNSPYFNAIHLPMLFFLCANVDGQVVTTQKGAADYVTKHITKYGAGQSVNARVASLLDDIITKLPAEKKATVASIMSKAFIATAVPDTLSSLEAWHVLLGLKRTSCSRGFAALNLDAALRPVACPETEKDMKRQTRKRARAQTDGHDRPEDKEEATTSVIQKIPVEHYVNRLDGNVDGAIRDWLQKCNLATFQAEVDRRGSRLHRREKPKIIKLKPYLNLDMAGPNAPKMARLTLRAYRPFADAPDDPVNISDDAAAVQQLEEFIHSTGCDRWLRARYEQHNMKRGRKRKRPLREDRAASGSEQLSAAAGPSAELTRGADDNMGESDADDGSFLLSTRQFIAIQFDMRWYDCDQTCLEQPFSVSQTLHRADNRRISTTYVKTMIEALRPASQIPQKKYLGWSS
jgi:hypothetical protein